MKHLLFVLLPPVLENETSACPGQVWGGRERAG